MSSWEWQAERWLRWARTPATTPARRYALEEYAAAFEAAGLLVERLREPAAPPAAAASHPSYHRWQRLPLFLHLRAVKR